jgi:hypothetical protein
MMLKVLNLVSAGNARSTRFRPVVLSSRRLRRTSRERKKVGRLRASSLKALPTRYAGAIWTRRSTLRHSRPQRFA